MKDAASGGSGPIYLRIVDMICQKIHGGEWSPGSKLPTVRRLAEEFNISCGTVKHAYDELELLGMIEMTQGRGTFVCDHGDKGGQGKKEQAMEAIDAMFLRLEKLGFSSREIRIFLDLKLREREEQYRNVRVGVVDCNPEALSIIESQLSTLPGIDSYKFLLEDVLAAPYRLEDNLDLILTTSNHLTDVQGITSDRGKLMFMVLSPSQNTIIDLAKIDRDMKVGILCSSHKFAEIISDSCQRFCTLSSSPEILLLGKSEETQSYAAGRDVLITPPNYLGYCNKKEEEALRLFREKGNQIVAFDYQIDKGSFYYLRERIEKIYRSKS